MNKTWLVAMALVALGFSGCGTGTHDFTSATDIQRKVAPAEATTLDLELGYSLTVPAGTFTSETIVLFSKRLYNELTFANFPTPTKAVGDLIGGVVINTPADILLHQNMTLTFGLSAGSGAVAGDQLVVYRFDRYTGYWNVWGSTVATVGSSGATATAILPTADFIGFVGSLALFKGMTVATLPVGVTTTIQGTVFNSQNLPIATDVALSVVVGSKKFPAAVTGGRVPLGGTVANTIDSAADGTFTIHIPDNLIGQPVNLEFGREDTNYRAQDLFDLLSPAVPSNGTNFMVIRYGANHVKSRPVASGAG
jgi:hypothetical protein